VLAATSEGSPGATIPPTIADHLRLHAIAAARATLSHLRSHGEIGDDAFHTIEEELDRLELSAERP
jgi:CPA1 family monovalent cation:H+ antiporter